VSETKVFVVLGIGTLFALFWIGDGIWSLTDGAWVSGVTRIGIGVLAGLVVSVNAVKRIRAADDATD
jgi:hypothetical protein